jgi:hypothetical protein
MSELNPSSTVVLTEIEFKREKLGARLRFTQQFIESAGISVVKDYVHEGLAAQMEAFLLSHSHGTQEITVYHKRPTFLQWLFRKHITITVRIECKELFKNPPKIKGNQFIYVATQLPEIP